MNKDIIPNGLAELIDNCKVPVVVADTSLEDAPLTIINTAFSDMTGYSSEAMVGKNCRFLQPASGVGPVKDRIRAFLADDQQLQSQFVIPNARKDGTRFLNLLYLKKLTHPKRPPLIIGSQFDISSRSATQLAAYNASLKYDMRLIEKLMKEAGWTMPPSDTALADSLERIAQFEL